MMDTAGLIATLLATAATAALFWLLHRDQRAAAQTEIAQLHRAAELLERHAVTMDAFLADSMSPHPLKRLLIDLSDAMAQPDTAKSLFAWMAAQRGQPASESPEVHAMVDALYGLRQTRADLYANFLESVGSAMAGARLRWADADALPMQTVVTPEKEVSIAYTATMLRPGKAFSYKSPLPAVA